MENQLQERNIHPQHIVLSEKEIKLSAIIYHVNQLTAYPLSAIQIEDWARSINELRPNQNLFILKSIINMMKIGSIDFNSRIGIQNIFLALKKYDKIKIGYVLVKEQSNERINGLYPTIEKEYYYYEDDKYPNNLTWLIDKEQYESFHLNLTIPDKDHFLQELN